jgi:ferredoxin-nitrite reductase
MVKPIEAVDIWIGGKVKKDAHLGKEVMKKIPCENLKLVLRDLLIKHFEVGPKEEALTSA